MIPFQEQESLMRDGHFSVPIMRICIDSAPFFMDDDVVLEEALEVRVNDQPLTVTMRTPGDDFELVAGFMRCEGLIATVDDIASMEYEARSHNIVRVALRPGTTFDPTQFNRNFVSSSSCGLCGQTSAVDTLMMSAQGNHGGTQRFPIGLLCELPARLKEAQVLFHKTGGSHAAGLFDCDGSLICCKEDIGRHNAVDKAIGWCVMANIDVSHLALCISGRASFEILQKVIRAGIGAVIAVGAPSNLAVSLARDFQITLVAFASDLRCNVYAGADL